MANIKLSKAEKDELMPLLNISQQEKELMPKEILDKLEILKKEQEKQYAELHQIIEESLTSLEQKQFSKCYSDLALLKRLNHTKKIKQLVWWDTHHKVYLANKKAQSARRNSKKRK